MMSSLDEDKSLKDKRGLSSSPRCQSMAVKYVLVLICSFTQEIPSTFKTRSKQTRQQDMLLSMSVVKLLRSEHPPFVIFVDCYAVSCN